MTISIAARAAVMAVLCFVLAACSQTAVSSYNGDIGTRSLSAKTTAKDKAREKKILAARQRAAKKRIASREAFLEARKARLEKRRGAASKQTAKRNTKKTRVRKTAAVKKAKSRKVARVSRKASKRSTRKVAKSTKGASNARVAKGPKVDVEKKTSAFVGGKSRGIARNGKSWKCVPARLKKVLNQVSKKFGRVIVSSTHRSSSHNRKVGGKKRSYHLKCAAVDFKVAGKTRGLLRWLANHPSVGGYKYYRSTGHYHIDTGPKRSW